MTAAWVWLGGRDPGVLDWIWGVWDAAGVAPTVGVCVETEEALWTRAARWTEETEAEKLRAEEGRDWGNEEGRGRGAGECNSTGATELLGMELGGRKPCALTGATGAMKVGGGSATDLARSAEMEEEEEEGGGEEEDRAPEVGGDEATGRTGVRKETGDRPLRGTAPPAAAAAKGLAVAAVAAAGGEVGRTADNA